MHLNTVAKYIRRSPYQSISAVLIMTLTFFTISTFLILSLVSIKVIDYFGSKPTAYIFFQDTATKDEISSMQKQLEGTGKTAQVTYVPKEEALKKFRKLNEGEDPILNDIVSNDALPSSIEVQPIKAEYLEELVNTVKDSPAIDKIVFQKDIIESFIRFVNAIKIIGASVISILIVVSIFIILTIIGIKITIRREEIETMKLIGASNWFIRMPFLIEGALYGLIGSLIGLTFCYGVLLVFQPSLVSFFRGVPAFPLPPLVMLEVLGAEVLTGIVLGAFASYLAVLRYLK